MTVAVEPVLLEVTRGGLVESRHRGTVVLLNASGNVSVAGGQIDLAVFGRSALKPLQAAAMVAAGFAGTPSSLALAAGSHDGEDVHLAGVRSVLTSAGVDETALRCPADLPMGRGAMLAYVAAGGVATRVCHNCSGKHAAMLATCAANGWDLGSYLAPDHPLQDLIRSSIEQVCRTSITATSVDGCGAPAHALPLVGLARGFAALAGAATDPLSASVAAAMRAHPRLVGGTGRAVTELMAEVDGLVCKDGAEGIWAAALPDGRAFAVKVADGSVRALPPLLAAALRHWGFDGEAVRRWSRVGLLGGGSPVGAITWSAELRDLLDL